MLSLQDWCWFLYPLCRVFLQTLPDPPSSSNPIQWVWYGVFALLLLGLALIILLSRKREDVQVTNEKRAVAAEGLVKTRDQEITDLNKELERVKAELGKVESENKILAGVKIAELAQYWQQKLEFETEFDALKLDYGRATRLIERLRDGGDIHDTKS